MILNKGLFFLLFLLGCGLGYGQSYTKYKGKKVLVYPTDSIFSHSVGIIDSLPDGDYYGFYYNNTANLALNISYSGGEIHGKYVEYYSSSKDIRYRCTYVNGLRQGPWMRYDYSYPGVVQHEGKFLDNKRHGFVYSYSTSERGTYTYNTMFYENGRQVYNVWGLNDSTVHYDDYSMKYYLQPKSKIDSNGGKEVRGKEEGLWRRYHRYSGNLSSIGVYHHGRKHGAWKDYHRNGKLKSEYICDSELEGSWLVRTVSKYDSLGNRLDIGSYSSTSQGHSMDYHADGKMRKDIVYDSKDCKKSEKYYLKTGVLKREEYFKNCEMHGTQTSYYETGELSSKVMYKRGRYNGPVVYYHKNGNISTVGTLKNIYRTPKYMLWSAITPRSSRRHPSRLCGTGRRMTRHRQGTWIKSDSTGEITSVINFRFGEHHGPERLYHDNKVFYETHFRGGKQHGSEKEWNVDGTLILFQNYRWGMLLTSKKYYSSGTLKSEEHFTDPPKESGLYYWESVKHGKQRYWNFAGDLVKVETFEHGKQGR